MQIALAGPIQELYQPKRPFKLANVAEFTDDWQQAWQAAGALWPDEQRRLLYLLQQIECSGT